jgi:hypothetical protein
MPRFLYNVETSYEIEAPNESEAMHILNGDPDDHPDARLIDRDVMLVEVDGEMMGYGDE